MQRHLYASQPSRIKAQTTLASAHHQRKRIVVSVSSTRPCTFHVVAPCSWSLFVPVRYKRHHGPQAKTTMLWDHHCFASVDNCRLPRGLFYIHAEVPEILWQMPTSRSLIWMIATVSSVGMMKPNNFIHLVTHSSSSLRRIQTCTFISPCI